MGEQVAGAVAAKSLGIYLGQLYGWVKAGKVKNYKPDGKYVVDGGKGLIVDIDEAREAWMTSKKKSPRTPGEPRAKRTRRTKGEGGEVVAERAVRRLPAGTMVSYETGKYARSTKAGPPKYTIAQVLASTGKLTYLDSGDHHRSYTGMQIDNVVFGTDRLSTMLAKGVVRVEHPTQVLGMLLLAFVMEDKVDLAESLEKWMIKNNIEVIVPELMDLEEEEDEPIVRGKPVMLAEQEDEEDDDDDE